MSILDEHDLGTPAPDRGRVPAPTDVELTIDGQTIQVAEGTSVMRAAGLAGVDIPKLCATDRLDAFGSCRMCLVEIDGRKGTPASCTTPVTPGMSVTTQSPRLERLRRGVMELYISDHPLDCLTCAANGDCELQDTAGQVGLRDVRYGFAGENHLELRQGRVEPVLHVRFVEVHRVLALRARLRGGAGNVRARPSRDAASARVSPPAPAVRSSSPTACRAARACRCAPRPR